MNNSLEVRSPFLDNNIKNFAYSIPKSNIINQNVGKVILRELIAELIPKNLMTKEKKVFSAIRAG